MPVEDKKTPYEILLRFDESGGVQGAHVRYLRRITVDGELLKSEVGEAQPIDLEGFPTSALMSDATKAAVAQVVAMKEEIAKLQQQIRDMQEKAGGNAG